MTPTPQEKAWELLERVNGQPITKEDWQRCSEYAKSDLKRKTKLIVTEVLCVVCAIDGKQHFQDYYEQVEEEIKRA